MAGKEREADCHTRRKRKETDIPIDDQALEGTCRGIINAQGGRNEITLGRKETANHTHMILPPLTQKCDSQPFFSQMEGCSVGRPSRSMLHVHLGFTSWGNSSSIVLPHPQGHLKPTHQSSEPSLTRTSSRNGICLGSTSPSTTRNPRAGMCSFQG